VSGALDPSAPAGARALERLLSDEIGWLTTVDPEGRPQSSPVWFLWADGEICIYSHRRAPRNDNVRERPLVAFNLNTDATGDEVVTMEGVARIDPSGPRASENPPYLEKYRARIAGYGWTVEWFEGEYPLTIRITPTRWRVA
jgi:PPOX class probable F420-dependent enzyme